MCRSGEQQQQRARGSGSANMNREDRHWFLPWHCRRVRDNVQQRSWRCMCCLRVVTSLSSAVAKGRCAGHADKLRQVTDPSLNHRLVVAEVDSNENSFVILCSACGCWCSQNPRKLLHVCRGYKTRAGDRDSSALLSGQHPKRDAQVGNFVPLAV